MEEPLVQAEVISIWHESPRSYDPGKFGLEMHPSDITQSPEETYLVLSSGSVLEDASWFLRSLCGAHECKPIPVPAVWISEQEFQTRGAKDDVAQLC